MSEKFECPKSLVLALAAVLSLGAGARTTVLAAACAAFAIAAFGQTESGRGDVRWITVAEAGPAADRTTEYVRAFANRGRVVRAVWTMTGLGVFDAYVNGRLVGTDVLKPGYTHFARTKYLYEYDVTELLEREAGGRNVLAAVQSGGWWSDGCVWGFRDGTRRKNAFRAELVLTYADGTADRVATDAHWRAAYGGPVVKASIWGGETYDARIEPTWRTDGTREFPAAAETDWEFAGELLPMVGPKIGLREDLTMKPSALTVWSGSVGAGEDRYGTIRVLRTPKPGETVRLAAGERLLADFSQNAAALPRLVASADAGVRIVIRGAETVNDGDGLKSRGNDGPGGSPYFANYRRSRETNFTYVFGGRGIETAMPRHTFFGYRYLQLEATGAVSVRSLESVPVTSVSRDLERGTLVTGHADVNRLIGNCVWGMRSNYLSVPTDCPQRDERQGWTADTQVFSLAATYVADVGGFLRKWMRDMRDSQNANGGFAIVAPLGDGTERGFGSAQCRRIGWSDAGIIVPHVVWSQSGDTAVIDENWSAMVRYMDLLEKSKYRTIAGSDAWGDGGFQFGDWLSLERWESHANWDYLSTHHDAEDYWNFLGASYWVLDARMMAAMAEATGRTEATDRFRKMAADALAYMRCAYLAPDGLLLDKLRDLQTATLFALKVGLFETEAARARTAGLLRENFAAHGGCLQTGFLGTSVILDVVAEHLSVREAYDLVLQRREPSWLFSVDNGATTMWERWNSYTRERGFGPVEMNSFNHYAYGAVLGWMYGTMAGLRPGAAGGWRRFTLAPKPDRRIGSVKAAYRTPQGLVRSDWAYERDGTWSWTFSIPDGSVASVILPDGRKRECVAGTYSVREGGK